MKTEFKKTYIALFAILGAFILSCEETIQIDTGELSENVVIEGLITNEQNHYVRLTRTRTFYANGPAERIENASVSVADDNGNTYQFVHNPMNNPEEDGFYYPVNTFQGQIGTTYSLSVSIDGEQYGAAEELLPVTAIDSLTVILNEDELEEPEEEGRFYEVLFYASEPQDRKDQYLFKFYNNGEIVKDFPTDIYFSDDDLLGEKIDDLEIAGFYKLGERVEVEMYSLTQEAFIFYSDLFNLLNNDGGMFSPPPANPRSNLSNGALGYFQVSAVARDQIIIEAPDED